MKAWIGVLLFGVGIGVGVLGTKTRFHNEAQNEIAAYVKEQSDTVKAVTEGIGSAQDDAHALRERIATLQSTSFNVQNIQKCMHDATRRSQAIDVYLAGTLMSDVERGSFQPLAPIALQYKDASHSVKQTNLFIENHKLNLECLDSARIRYPDALGTVKAPANS